MSTLQPRVIIEDRTLSDENVVRRVCAGEPALFEILMRRYNQRLFRAARAILQSDSEAEDAIQQAYLSAFANLASFSHRSSFATWLTRIAINEAVTRRGSRARRAEVELDDGDDPLPHLASSGEDPEQATSGRELTLLIERAIGGLPESYRVVFVLREVQQLSTAETAACLDLSEEAVKVRLHRAKHMLRDALLGRVDAATRDAFSFLGARCDRVVAYVMSRLPGGQSTPR
jgi:RNA polymerase sigma-70 factor (ECF subfamily)